MPVSVALPLSRPNRTATGRAASGAAGASSGRLSGSLSAPLPGALGPPSVAVIPHRNRVDAIADAPSTAVDARLAPADLGRAVGRGVARGGKGLAPDVRTRIAAPSNATSTMPSVSVR